MYRIIKSFMSNIKQHLKKKKKKIDFNGMSISLGSFYIERLENFLVRREKKMEACLSQKAK